jgi:hypothetical protein
MLARRAPPVRGKDRVYLSNWHADIANESPCPATRTAGASRRRSVLPSRHFPVRPNLEQLRHQAKDLLRSTRKGDAAALDDLEAFHPNAPDAGIVRLADAQLVLARSYGLPSWPRLLTACRMTDAICRGDVETVRALVLRDPRLLEEDARGVKGNWGPPMSYAANLGQNAIALFATVVSQPNFWINLRALKPDAPFTRLLLDHGADPNARASLRKELHRGYEIPGMREYRSVTPVSWGQRFHFQKLVNQESIRMIAERGGRV